MDNRFANWNGSNMSEAARSVMIRNVSNAILIHHMTSFRLPDVTIKKMSSSQQKFWRNKKTCKGNHIITWRRVQKPKEEGGLGFRDMHTFNRALLAKSYWRLSSDTESMMAKSLQEKYFQDGDLFNLKNKTNTTWSWRSLSSELYFVQANSCWCLGDGKMILIWQHRWIQVLPHPPVPRQGSTTHLNFKYVCELFNQSKNSWNLDLLHELFDLNTVNLIWNTQIHINCEDRLIWLLKKNGRFSVKSAYRKLHEEHNNSESIEPRMIKI
ncbi:uncharacterized protein LOC113272265 [Papaver somniferum]|uniref:uncharacterized protein LOC113272265 n=1 Tax=Papaver somniferum TaxID=3469 RepID=UPI000E6F832C|nr:uncharacterized protein LOC113272265 [Papaver somniferum]